VLPFAINTVRKRDVSDQPTNYHILQCSTARLHYCTMDDYPAADPIPDPDRVSFQHHELIEFLTDNSEMRKAAKNSLQQGLFAGGGAVAGGILLGPIGGLVGGVVGSIMGFFHTDDYDGALQQIIKLEGVRKDMLLQAVSKVLVTAGATAQSFETAEAFRMALVQFASQRTVREQVWRACINVVESED